MEIILSPICASFTGSLGKGYGYAIRMYHSRDGKKHFYSVRYSRDVPPNGHWLFIVACAELALAHVFFDDIHLPMNELKDALAEAGINQFLWYEKCKFLKAKDILTLKRINHL